MKLAYTKIRKEKYRGKCLVIYKHSYSFSLKKLIKIYTQIQTYNAFIIYPKSISSEKGN